MHVTHLTLCLSDFVDTYLYTIRQFFLADVILAVGTHQPKLSVDVHRRLLDVSTSTPCILIEPSGCSFK